ncbi:MAG: DUF2304 domain-containing protein [Lachnospiraceae bacterium]|nr:DUF2304 domain-containing protein [Lachnospiraceae bacterium]
MTMGMILQAIMIVLGGVLLCQTISSLARRKMTEPFCLTWGLISVIVVLAGCLLRPSGIAEYISGTGLILVVLIGFCIVYGAFFMSQIVSDLMRKNNELAIQVSLLNEERDQIYRELDVLKGQGANAEGQGANAEGRGASAEGRGTSAEGTKDTAK